VLCQSGYTVFSITGSLVNGAPLDGTIVIDTSSGTISTRRKLTIGAPINLTLTDVYSALDRTEVALVGNSGPPYPASGPPFPHMNMILPTSTLVGYGGGPLCSIQFPCSIGPSSFSAAAGNSVALEVGSINPRCTECAVFSEMSIGSETNVTFVTNISYSLLPQQWLYALSASTDKHCYRAGISFAEGKARLFIRAGDHDADSVPQWNNRGCDVVNDSPINADEPNTKAIETTIKSGGTVAAELALAKNGKVEMSVSNDANKDSISSTLEDTANTFYWPPFRIPPDPPIEQIVTHEKQKWIFKVSAPTPPPPAPPPKVTRTPRVWEVLASVPDVHFDVDKFDISGDAQQILENDAVKLKEIIQGTPGLTVIIEAHCDRHEDSPALGDRRATAVKEFLVQLGVPADQLTTISYGRERPVCTEQTVDCDRRNRRVHLIVL
jgi:outer membrane protein OmpA-like peptidoglycan-associated protein